MSPPATSKTELRQIYRNERSRLFPADVAEFSSRIADRFFATFNLTHIKVVSTFIRIPRLNEIDTSTLYFRIWRDHPDVRTAAPVIDIDSGSVKNVEFNAASEFVENRWGIREPIGSVVGPDEIDL